LTAAARQQGPYQFTEGSFDVGRENQARHRDRPDQRRQVYGQAKRRPKDPPTKPVVIRPDPSAKTVIEVIDGDTIQRKGIVYRLVGFDTPERGDLAKCDDERQHAKAATGRLRRLVAGGDVYLTRVSCACRPGTEGTRNCNYGRLCASLSIGGRDVGQILIGEGLAHPALQVARNGDRGAMGVSG
jgi:endonuclease YncB( thermonuclease family)